MSGSLRWTLWRQWIVGSFILAVGAGLTGITQALRTRQRTLSEHSVADDLCYLVAFVALPIVAFQVVRGISWVFGQEDRGVSSRQDTEHVPTPPNTGTGGNSSHGTTRDR